MPKTLPPELRSKLAVCSEFPLSVMFLDIETTGLSLYYDEITLVGWSFGGLSKTLVKGGCAENFLRDASNASALITFNGIRFDTKFIEKEFRSVDLPRVHIDLMYLCRRVGLTGGQKAIERELGINCREGISDIDGVSAVLLWNRYLRGDNDALRLLIQYNRADIAAMGAIFDATLSRLGYEPDLLSEGASFEKLAASSDSTNTSESLPSAPPYLKNAPTFHDLFHGLRAASAKVIGIDLTGSELRASGWCALNGHRVTTAMVYKDSEVVEMSVAEKPDLISIDSPLSLPTGRTSVYDDDPGRKRFGILRESERELKRRGINVYPCLIPSMQKLTARGIDLATKFRRMGIPVIESYPGAAQDIMRIPRKGAGAEFLKMGLAEFGVEGNYKQGSVTHDELDAITSALVGTFHLAKLSEELSSQNEAPMIIPRLQAAGKPLVVGVSGPIAAGKTTFANILRRFGFVYTRFSLVVDEFLRERGLELNRVNRQRIGLEINRSGRQRELAMRTISQAASAQRIVVDGLRFPEDHAFLVETFGFEFRHVFIDAAASERLKRFAIREGVAKQAAAQQFHLAQTSEVERQVSDLRNIAHIVYFNVLKVCDLTQDIETRFDWLKGERVCL